MMKKNSFIKRLFLSLILLYLFVFVGMFLFQKIIFQRFYTNRVIRTTITEIDDAFTNLPTSDPQDLIVEFSQSTQTTAVIIPAQELKDDIEQLSLLVATVTTNNGTVRVFIPNRTQYEEIIGESIQGQMYLHEPSGIYVPLQLTIDGTRVMRSMGGQINMIYRDLIQDIDTTSKTPLNGEISDITAPSTVNAPGINPLVSNEVLNILSENYENATKFDSGFYYTSIEEEGFGNLVFYSNQEVDGNNVILIAVYPLSHIDDIIRAMQLVNIYIFIAVLSILVFTSFIYSKRFSTPILKLNLATKELSNLNFNTPLDMGSRNDEFSELADNIILLSKNLEETLGRLNQQNQQLSESLKRENESEESRIQFIRGMSHELKTPLAVIQASSEAIQNDVYSSAKDKVDSLNLINSEVQKISGMINNMMHVYRIDNPQYKESWKTFDLSSLYQEYQTNLQVLIDKNNLALTSTIEPSMVYGDPDKIGMVISNLMTNAIKYTPAQGLIDVSIFTKDEDVYFRIENTSTAIPKENIQHLFEPFYRVDKARSRNDGNSGLGLYIVQQTLKQHDSICTVNNSEKGVVFEFKLKSSD